MANKRSVAPTFGLLLLLASTGCVARSSEHRASVTDGRTAYVSDMPFDTTANGWGPVERDQSMGEQAAGDGTTLTLNGVAYSKGLGAHAYSEVHVALNGRYQTFSSDVGVDDSAGSKGSVDFKVYADDVLLFDSGTMTGDSDAQSVDVSVTGANQLTLIATDAAGNHSRPARLTFRIVTAG